MIKAFWKNQGVKRQLLLTGMLLLLIFKLGIVMLLQGQRSKLKGSETSSILIKKLWQAMNIFRKLGVMPRKLLETLIWQCIWHMIKLLQLEPLELLGVQLSVKHLNIIHRKHLSMNGVQILWLMEELVKNILDIDCCDF